MLFHRKMAERSEEFGKYCDDIVNTAAWGGQLELRALSHILQTPIEILQADAPPVIVGEEYPRDPLVLVYMRHVYGLGEHYNSVTRLVNSATENLQLVYKMLHCFIECASLPSARLL